MKFVPVIIAGLVLVVAGGAYYFLAAPDDDSAAEDRFAVDTAALQQDLDRTEAERTQLRTDLAAAEERIEQLEAGAGG